MAGASSIPARRAFATSLVEKLFGPEAESIKPLQTLDEGVLGYTFDLVPIRLSLETAEKKYPNNPFHPPPEESLPPTPPTTTAKSNSTSSTPPSEVNLDPVIPSHTDQLSRLLQASLAPLPISKLRLVNTVQTPHEILRLISSVGVDLFDAHWAQRAADIGVALDFTFPAPCSSATSSSDKHDIGHNLYSPIYTHDFSSFTPRTQCPCNACSPLSPTTIINHTPDHPYESRPQPQPQPAVIKHEHEQPKRLKPSYTRAYLHHLLRTHEMSAHSLLVMHNIAVLDMFFDGLRTVIQRDYLYEGAVGGRGEEWEREVKRFEEYYDETLVVFEEAKTMWRDVDLARGKGRLAREKQKQEEGTLETLVDL
jgi:queuine tRNA-ribosyltransferase